VTDASGREPGGDTGLATPPADPAPTHHAIEAVWRLESARLIASLARVVGDVGLAEELAAALRDAATMTRNERERTLLLERAAACHGSERLGA